MSFLCWNSKGTEKDHVARRRCCCGSSTDPQGCNLAQSPPVEDRHLAFLLLVVRPGAPSSVLAPCTLVVQILFSADETD